MNTAKTVVFGNGKTAGEVVQELLQKGSGVIVATPQPEVAFDPATAEVLTGVALARIRAAETGGYDLTFAKGQDSISRRAARVVLCDDYERVPEFHRYGLTACSRVISLSQLVAKPEKFSKRGHSTVFLSGIYRESHPMVLRETMTAAMRLAHDHAQKAYILTGNLKVAARGLEALYRQARQAGVTVVKFHREKPAIAQLENGGTAITFKDEITDHHFRLNPDLTVVDEMISASEDTAVTAGMLAVHQDQDGFAQMDNVHRLPILTNRRGILAVGPSRTVQDREQQLMDVGNAGLCALPAAEAREDATAAARAEIDPGRCVRCLTCFRLCPYGAVDIETRVRVAAHLCEGCGICAAECPQGAINMHHLPSGGLAEQMDKAVAAEGDDDFQPAIYAFCCSRSASPAACLAGCLGYESPAGLNIIQVPCAGAVATGDLLKAFQNQADGVLVLTCHTGNCHAEEGNQHARRRSTEVQTALERIGLQKERLLRSTLAANMGAEFGEIVSGFAETLKAMGPALQR